MAFAARNLAEAPTDDATLVERVKLGDEAAFSALYRRHAQHVACVVYRLLGNDEHLDDIVQETFVIGLRSLDRLREPGSLKRWLTTIAVRRVQRCLATRYKSRALRAELCAVAPRLSEPTGGEEVHALYRALAQLPDKIRIPWMLHHIEGETLPVVAEMCDTSLTSVKRHIAAASERLRRLSHA
jgi:RNA polymerase sigma-70 factor (ECF subfamily)